MKKTFLTVAVCAASSIVASAQSTTIAPVFSNNFGTGYTNGNLVGQDGWTQTGTTSNNPIQISGDQAVLPSGATGQDAWKAFDTVVSTATPGDYLLTTINFTLTNVPSATGDYFFHLSSPAGTTSTFFQRLFARSATEGFQLGISGGSSATGAGFGSTVLSLNQSYEAVIKWDFVSGTLNDVLSLYIDPTDPVLTNNPVYASTNFISTEPTTVAAANLRIGGTGTAGALVDSIEVVPEPSSYALLALGAAGLGAHLVRRRRRR